MSDATETLRYTLTTLLDSTPYRLAYALPLLFLSLTAAFAGTFLTLDRTRIFPSHHTGEYASAINKNKGLWFKITSWYPLQGGIGGLISGFLFGLHLSTFLSLVIPSTSPMARLNRPSFLAIWLLSSIISALAGGRHRLPATVFTGLSGGTTFSLSLCIMIHPSLQFRVIFTSICMPLLLILCVIPFERTWRFSLRLAHASTGAFGVMLVIALFLDIPAWSNFWERLWIKDHIEWGGSKEQGLSAGWALMLVAGMVVDWFLHSRIGECPDQEWDAYLANYAYSLPNQVERAGTFHPKPPTFWDRLLGRNTLTPGYNWQLGPDLLKSAPTETVYSQDTLTASPITPYTKVPTLDTTTRTMANVKLGTRGSMTLVGDLDLKAPPPSASPSLGHLPGFFSKAGKLRNKKKRKTLGGITTGFRKSSGGSGTGTGSSNGSSGGLGGGGRKPVKFRPLGDVSSDGEDSSDDETARDLGGNPNKPWVHQTSLSGSTPTLVAGNATTASPTSSPTVQYHLPRGLKAPPPKSPVEYSDYEEDVTNLRHQAYPRDKGENAGEKGWTPGFMSRKNTQDPAPTSPTSPATPVHNVKFPTSPQIPIPSLAPPLPASPSASGIPGQTPKKPITVPMPIPVPATPSLIRAIDRINAAHKTALVPPLGRALSPISSERSGAGRSSPVQPRVHNAPPSDEEIDGDERDVEAGHGAQKKTTRQWDEFWDDVKDRARQLT